MPNPITTWLRTTLFAERPPAPKTGEVATAKSEPDWDDLWSGDSRANPDPIVEKESNGDGIKLYDTMDRKDPQLSSFVATRINGVLSKDRHIEPGEDSDAARKLAAEAQAVFDGITDFEQDLREILRGLSHGFSVSEVMWERRGGRFDIADLMSRPQSRFKFDADWRLRMLTKDNQTGGEPVEKRYPRKFLVYTHNRAGMNRYGRGEYQYCYWPYFFKRNAIKFWSIFMEKRAIPPVVARYDRETTSKEQRADIKTALENFVHDTGIVMPDDIELDFVQITSSVPLNTMKNFVDVMAEWQAQRVLGQTLTTGKGAPGLGQGGVAQQHGQVRQEYVEADSKELLPTLNAALRWWVDVNRGPQERYPHWTIDYEPAKDLEAQAKVDEIVLTKIGLPVATEDLYERYGHRKPEEGDELLEPPQKPAAATAFAELDPRQRAALDRIHRDRTRIEDDAVADGKMFFDEWREALDAHLKKKADGA